MTDKLKKAYYSFKIIALIPLVCSSIVFLRDKLFITIDGLHLFKPLANFHSFFKYAFYSSLLVLIIRAYSIIKNDGIFNGSFLNRISFFMILTIILCSLYQISIPTTYFEFFFNLSLILFTSLFAYVFPIVSLTFKRNYLN